MDKELWEEIDNIICPIEEELIESFSELMKDDVNSAIDFILINIKILMNSINNPEVLKEEIIEILENPSEDFDEIFADNKQ